MAKNQKVVLCRNCNNTMSKGTKICPACGAKNKKPYYKKGWFIFIVIIAVIGIIGSIGGGKKTEKIDWDDIVLGDMIPEPKTSKGNVIINSDTSLNIDITKVAKSDYKEYVSECEEMGYSVEAEKSSDMYRAYNEKGYEITLLYMNSKEELNIHLDAPVDMDEFKWPSSDLAKLLPVPKSTTGKISRESSEGFYIQVANTSLDDYAAYVEKCSTAGFNVEYDKGDKFYHAYDANGNYASITYTGNNVMTVELSRAAGSDKITETEKAEDASKENKEDDNSNLVDGMRSEFKVSMDKYEEFMNEYCAFMKKYAESNGTDIGLLADYAEYMSKYADMMKSFEEWEGQNLNEAETLYYIDVQTRINKKLVEVGAGQ